MKIAIKTKSKYYFVEFSDDIEKEILTIRKENPNHNLAIITDSNLMKIYSSLLENMKKHGILSYAFPSGEEHKNIHSKLEIEDFLFQNNFNRKSILIAFGGGVVGDLVGYVAATFMRGVSFYQIPTTIIAMTDSSVGGKTGIDNQYGKNLIGAFYQPEAVFINIFFLKTLPRVEFIAGFAEVLKYAFIEEKKLYDILSIHSVEEIRKNDTLLKEIISMSILVKNRIVSKDEKETAGYREVLNFGHTVGHAIENLMNYKIRHGEAIAIGMAIESFFSFQLNELSFSSIEKVLNLLKNYELPHQIPNVVENKEINSLEICQVMRKDKKNHKDKIKIILIKDISSLVKKENVWGKFFTEKIIIELIEEYREKVDYRLND